MRPIDKFRDNFVKNLLLDSKGIRTPFCIRIASSVFQLIKRNKVVKNGPGQSGTSSPVWRMRILFCS